MEEEAAVVGGCHRPLSKVVVADTSVGDACKEESKGILEYAPLGVLEKVGVCQKPSSNVAVDVLEVDEVEWLG